MPEKWASLMGKNMFREKMSVNLFKTKFRHTLERIFKDFVKMNKII